MEQWRHDTFMETQTRISRERLLAEIGKRMQVLVDTVSGGQAVARSSADAPEIDGNVFIREAIKLRPGDWAEVKIEASNDHDLWARLV